MKSRRLDDAAQNASFEDDELLANCRNSGQHDRGSWVVEMVLGKV